MFLVTSTYTAPPEAIERLLPDHRNWVATLYERGIFFLSGRLVPPTGGFMMARDISLGELQTILATDPFRIHHLLEHTIIELSPTRWSPELDFLKENAR